MPSHSRSRSAASANFWLARDAVEVLDAEEQAPAARPGVKVRDEKRPRVPEMKQAGRARRETSDRCYFLHAQAFTPASSRATATTEFAFRHRSPSSSRQTAAAERVSESNARQTVTQPSSAFLAAPLSRPRFRRDSASFRPREPGSSERRAGPGRQPWRILPRSRWGRALGQSAAKARGAPDRSR